MGRIVIPRPRLRSGASRGPSVALRRPTAKRRPLTTKQKYGVSEFEALMLALDVGTGLAGRAAAASETAERREQREAARQERTGAQEASRLAAKEALAELEPGDNVGGMEAFFASQRAAPSLMGGQRLSIGSLGPPAEGGQSRLRPGAILALDPRLAPEDLTDAGQQQLLRQQGIALADAIERGEMDALPAAGGSGEMAGLAAVERAEAAGALDIDARPGDVGGSETLMNRAAERAVRDAERRLEGLSRPPLPSPQVQLTYQQGQRADPDTMRTAVGATLASDMALDPAQTARQRAEIEAQYRAAQPTPQQQRASYIPTTLGEAQAMARFATTPEEMAAAMDQIDQLARATNFQDLITGDHIRRAQEAALKGWKPPRSETALDIARRLNVEQSTRTSRALEQERLARAKALQDELDEEAATLAEQAERLKGGSRRAKKTGKLVDQSVYFLQNYKAFSEGKIEPEAWEAGAGVFANDKPESIVAHAQRLKFPKKSISAISKGAPMLLRRGHDDPAPRADSGAAAPTEGTRRARRKEYLSLIKARGRVVERIDADRRLLMMTEGDRVKIDLAPAGAIVARLDAALKERDLVERQIEELEGETGATYSAPAEGSVFIPATGEWE